MFKQGALSSNTSRSYQEHFIRMIVKCTESMCKEKKKVKLFSWNGAASEKKLLDLLMFIVVHSSKSEREIKKSDQIVSL